MNTTRIIHRNPLNGNLLPSHRLKTKSAPINVNDKKDLWEVNSGNHQRVISGRMNPNVHKGYLKEEQD